MCFFSISVRLHFRPQCERVEPCYAMAITFPALKTGHLFNTTAM